MSELGADRCDICGAWADEEHDVFAHDLYDAALVPPAGDLEESVDE